MDLFFADPALQHIAESTVRSDARFGPGDGALLRQRLCELIAADNLAIAATVPTLEVQPLASREASFFLAVGPRVRLVLKSLIPQVSGNGEIDLAKVATIRILAIEKCDES